MLQLPWDQVEVHSHLKDFQAPTVLLFFLELNRPLILLYENVFQNFSERVKVNCMTANDNIVDFELLLWRIKEFIMSFCFPWIDIRQKQKDLWSIHSLQYLWCVPLAVSPNSKQRYCYKLLLAKRPIIFDNKRSFFMSDLLFGLHFWSCVIMSLCYRMWKFNRFYKEARQTAAGERELQRNKCDRFNRTTCLNSMF